MMQKKNDQNKTVFTYRVEAMEELECGPFELIAENFDIRGEYVVFKYHGANCALFKLPVRITTIESFKDGQILFRESEMK